MELSKSDFGRNILLPALHLLRRFQYPSGDSQKGALHLRYRSVLLQHRAGAPISSSLHRTAAIPRGHPLLPVPRFNSSPARGPFQIPPLDPIRYPRPALRLLPGQTLRHQSNRLRALPPHFLRHDLQSPRNAPELQQLQSDHL